MPVDRRLGVRVDVVEQREALRQRVRVGRDVRAEQRQLRVAVAARVVAEHLVVGAVLAHDVEDVLDLAAGPARRSASPAARACRWSGGSAWTPSACSGAARGRSGSAGCRRGRAARAGGTGTATGGCRRRAGWSGAGPRGLGPTPRPLPVSQTSFAASPGVAHAPVG